MVEGLSEVQRDRHPLTAQKRAEASLTPAAGTASAAAPIMLRPLVLHRKVTRTCGVVVVWVGEWEGGEKGEEEEGGVGCLCLCLCLCLWLWWWWLWWLWFRHCADDMCLSI